MVKQFSGLVRKANFSLWGLFNRTSRNSIKRFTQPVKFYTYDNIPLKLFLEVTETADYLLLVKEGKSTYNECFDQWEKIVQENCNATGNGEYRNYFNNIRKYNKLLAEFNIVKSSIMMLYFVIDDNMIADLNRRGYKINLKSNVDYVKSLNAAMNKSNNIISRIESLCKAIAKTDELNKSNYRKITFEALMANLITGLGIPIDDSLTLSRYNEFNKIIKKQNAHAQSRKIKRHGRV